MCLICTNVVLDPCECHGCGKLFCKVCISNWSTKNSDIKCPNRCTVNQITPIFSKALQRFYSNLDIRCSNAKCLKVVKLSDLPKHELMCKMSKCWNFELCQTAANEKLITLKPCCSEICRTLYELQEKIGDKKALFEVIGKFLSSKIELPPIPKPYPTSAALAWDPSKTGGGIALS